MWQEFDRTSMLAMLRWRAPGLVRFFQLVSYTGVGRAWILASLVLAILDEAHMRAFAGQSAFQLCLLAPLAAWAAGLVVKKIFSRPRPFQTIENFTPLFRTPLNDSFPSSHASSWMSFAVALALARHPFAPWAAAWAVLVSFSRVYLGVHYPTDVLGGALLGVACGFVPRLAL